MPAPGVKDLFNYSRFPHAGIAILYIPIGILLVLLRVIILVFVMLLSSTLPSNDLLRTVYQKLLCITFGISVNMEGTEKPCEDVDSIICNHISIFDSLVANILLKAVAISSEKDTRLSKLLGKEYFGPMDDQETIKNNIAIFATTRKQPVLLQPELTATNGKGLLKFNSKQVSICNKVQPVLLEIQRPVLDVSVTTIDSTFWVDAFFYMFSPLTIYKVVVLPPAEKKTFADAEFATKLQSDMAKSLKVAATQHTVRDMRDWQKQYLVERHRVQAPRTQQHFVSPELQHMANQVKEVLPMVPKQVILRDLSRTLNVDMTITNILEGIVPYTPEEASPSRPSTSGAVASTSSSLLQQQQQHQSQQQRNMADYSPKGQSFAKSANERMLSFQERKAELIANARQKYIEKNGLNNIALSNC